MIIIDADGCTVDQVLLAVKHEANMNAAEPVFIMGKPAGDMSVSELRRFMQSVNPHVSGADYNG